MLGRLRRCALLVALATAVAAGGKIATRRFLFPAQDLRPLPRPRGFVEHQLVAYDGVEVRALELAADLGARVVVHFHTNRETAEGLADLARRLHAGNLGVVLVEYRGYGRSRGTPTENGVYADAEAVLDMLAARGIGRDRIVLSGASLGTGVAAEMARRGRGAKLVLVTPYTSIPAVIEDAAPFVPASLFVEDRFDTLAKAPAIDVPTLVVHGDADEIVPFWMGEELAHRIRGAVLRRVHGGRHGDLFARDPALVDAIAEHARS
ncbi:MAG: alpha/beta hydrolase [Labilithrix sp.]|nr:alpha/beta hydrolase [Labilithrix sp.]MCW5817272.1 alpha/beta hydrolase [Labilithrix sp.]